MASCQNTFWSSLEGTQGFLKGENGENKKKNRRSNKLGLKFINSFGDDVGQWGVISLSLQAKEVVMQNYKDSEAFERGGSRRWTLYVFKYTQFVSVRSPCLVCFVLQVYAQHMYVISLRFLMFLMTCQYLQYIFDHLCILVCNVFWFFLYLAYIKAQNSDKALCFRGDQIHSAPLKGCMQEMGGVTTWNVENPRVNSWIN